MALTTLTQERHAENEPLNLEDRDWRWRAPTYRYAPSRVRHDPCYVGSYSMDCLAMALHCVHATSSFSDALLRAANLCGDADTVAAVTGQLAGAIYGLGSIPADWVAAVERWDPERTIRARAWLLFHAPTPAAADAHEQESHPSWRAMEVALEEERRRAAEALHPAGGALAEPLMTLGPGATDGPQEMERRKRRAERFAGAGGGAVGGEGAFHQSFVCD